VLGSGNVAVAAGRLHLRGTAPTVAIANSATLTIAEGAHVELETGVNETVRELRIGTARMWKGTWGATGSDALYTDPAFDGPAGSRGIITVSEGAPHPATLILFQ
jgi:hypothetical protein